MTDEPKVALVHDWLTGMRGGEKVLESIAELFPQAPIYTLFHFPGTVSEALEAHPILTSFLQRAPGLRKSYRRYLPLFPAAIEDFDLNGFDLVVSTSHCVAKGIVPPPGAFHLCYCHTPMRYAWDQEHAYFPRRRGLAARLRNLALTSLRSWDVGSAARVDRFVANSHFVAERIRRYYRREADVVAPPVDTSFFTPGDGDGTDYVLMVTALAPYKRIDLAIEACNHLGVELRIVGTGPEEGRLRQMALTRTSEGTASRTQVRFLGRVDGETLRDLYRRALCLLQPGVEDFGIAPVEALACGTPVVALGQGGVLDIVEDGRHGILFAEATAQEVALAIDKRRQILFNPLDLTERAAEFSPVRFQKKLRGLMPARGSSTGHSALPEGGFS